jgi:hypothetical protein
MASATLGPPKLKRPRIGFPAEAGYSVLGVFRFRTGSRRCSSVMLR